MGSQTVGHDWATFTFHFHRWDPQPSLEGRRVLKSGSVLGHLGLLTGLTQKENKLYCLFMTADSFTIWSKAPIKIRLPQKLGNRGAMLWWLHFKGMASRSLRKTFLSCKTGKRLREDLPLVGARKSLQLQIFWGKCSKEKDVEFYPLEETCLKFSQAERNVKAGLVSILQTLHSWGAELSVISKEGRLEYYRII